MRPLILLLLLAPLCAPALADPPDHAPAWGKRAKGDRAEHRGNGHYKHRGYTGAEWADDYGVTRGRCNTDTVLTALGAATGAVIGNRVAADGDRAVATIVGAIIGGVVGNKVGDALDESDRACMGQSLELAPVGRTVVWINPQTRVGYRVRPVRDLAEGCRVFEYGVDGRQGGVLTKTACRASTGHWSIRQR
jgi:surface antigen